MAQPANKYFYGIGLQFGRGEKGYFSTKADKRLITDNLKQIILTNPGERVHNPDFGVGLERYLFEPNDDILTSTLKDVIKTQVRKYLPIGSTLDRKPHAKLVQIAVLRGDTPNQA